MENCPYHVILQEAIVAGAFPGAVMVSARHGDVVLRDALGHLGVEAPFLFSVTPQTRYDLASVTKIYTLAASLMALRDAKLPLDTPVRHFWPAFDDKITLELLMAHASGLGFPLQALEQTPHTHWIKRIAAAPRVSAPGAAVLYSCTNYFLLARAVEHLSGMALDTFLQTRILAPLGLENTEFAPQNRQNLAPTEENGAGFWLGIPHDEAARSWRAQNGTCAGNAGLFADALDVARFAQIWTQNGAGLLHPEDVSRVFSTRFPEKTFARGLGFQLDAAFYMAENAPPGTAGHLGFTGPSLLLNSKTGHIAVILCNRVHPTRSGPDRLPFFRRLHALEFS